MVIGNNAGSLSRTPTTYNDQSNQEVWEFDFAGRNAGGDRIVMSLYSTAVDGVFKSVFIELFQAAGNGSLKDGQMVASTYRGATGGVDQRHLFRWEDEEVENGDRYTKWYHAHIRRDGPKFIVTISERGNGGVAQQEVFEFSTSDAFNNDKWRLLLEVQRDDLAGSTNIASVLADPDNLTGDTREYSYYVEPNGGGCADFTMTPYWDPTNDSGSFVTSWRVRNNDFLFYKHPGGALNLQLSYTTPDTGGGEERESDLDLFIYNEGGRFGIANDIVGSSQSYYDNDQTTTETETISGNLPAGDYLINVFVYTGTYDQAGCIGNPGVQVCQNDRVQAGDGLEYSLTANGVELCPATRP